MTFHIHLKNHLCVDDEIGGKGCHDQHIDGEVEEPEVHQPDQHLDTVGSSDLTDLVMVNIQQTPSRVMRTSFIILTKCHDS